MGVRITEDERRATLARLYQQVCNAMGDPNHPLVVAVKGWS